MRKESDELGINSIKSLLRYYTKKRHGVANVLSTIQENGALVDDEKIKMSPFYVEGDTRG